MNYASSLAAMTIGVLVLLIIILIPIYVIYLIGLWKLFKKAGKNGWEAIIPFYNTWVLVEIAELNWWWFLIAISSTIVSFSTDTDGLSALASIAVIFSHIAIYYNFSKKMHKDTVFVVLSVIFPIIMIPVAGFSKQYIWDNNVAVTKNGPFDTNKANEQSNNSNQSYTQSTSENNLQSQITTSNVKYCGNCGTKIETGNFCPNCGQKTSE